MLNTLQNQGMWRPTSWSDGSQEAKDLAETQRAIASVQSALDRAYASVSELEEALARMSSYRRFKKLD